MPSERLSLEPTKVGLGTVVRWSGLEGSDLKHAMKGVAGGGTKHPHLTLFQLLIGLANGQRSTADCAAYISRLQAFATREEFMRGLKNFVAYIGMEPRERILRPLPNRYLGPDRILAISTRSHFTFERGHRTHWGLIWNNKSPRLTAEAARLGCALMRQGVEANDNDLFEMIDVRNGKVFAATASEIDDSYKSMSNAVSRLEDAYKRFVP